MQRRISLKTYPTQKQSNGGTGGGPYLICLSAFAKGLASGAESSKDTDPHSGRIVRRTNGSPRPLRAILLTLLFLSGCNALNPLCGSARPAPVIGSLSASTITFAQVQQGFLLTVNGKHFVASSVVIVKGITLKTTVQSSQQLQVTIGTDSISGPGTATVTVNTPSGNSGNLGCSSGGNSNARTLTVT